MGGKRILRIAVTACAIALPACLHAQVTSAQGNLAAGISQARSGDFVNALVSLNDVVSQLAGRPDESTTLARAHAYRAVAFIGLEQPEWAKAAALLALTADPKIVVDANEFGARVVTLFDSARRSARDPEAAGQRAEAAGRFQDAFLGYLSAIQSLPEPPAPADDQRLREKIIKVVQKLEPKPTVPEEARTRLTKADALLNAGAVPGALSDKAAEQAAIELRKAVRIAPWWPDAMIKLAFALQRSDRVDEARLNLNLYQLADSDGNPAITTGGGPARDERTSAEPAPTAMAPAVIYVYFPHAARALGAKSKVLCDGQKVADLTHEHYVVLNASPGFHNFEFKGRKTAGSFEGGMNHYIRIGIEGYPAHFVLNITSPDKAVAEMSEKQVLLNEPKNTFSTECAPAAPVARKFK